MKTANIVFLLSALFSVQANAAPKFHLAFAPDRDSNATAALQFEALTFTQPVDETSGKTFVQHAYFSSTYAHGTNSPVIFYVGDEGPLTEGDLDAILSARAQQLGAYVVGIEHRYYGQSTPTVTSAKDLQALTSERALADFATIERKIIADRGLTGPWFAYGGSYGATMAAYYRMVYPELVQGAFAFSPPIQVTEAGLTQYETFASQAFGDALSAKVRAATTYILNLTKDIAGKVKVQNLLGLPNADFSTDDIAAILVTTIPEISQYGNIGTLSASLTDGQAPADAAAALGQVLASSGARWWDETPYGLRNDPTFSDETSRWVFEAYNEFGWMYVTDPVATRSLLPQPVTMDYYAKQYQMIFGSPLMHESAFSAQMQKIFEQTATRILTVNGTIDPWMATSLPNLQDTNRQMISVVVQGGSHCVGGFDALTSAGDPAYAAQQEFFQLFKSWSGSPLF
jgi:pimeloyl-ACP methyl ester carboxylesterase